MAQVGTAWVDVKPDLSSLNRQLASQLRGSNSRWKRYGAAIGKSVAVGVGAGAAGAAVALKEAIGDATDLGEQINKTRVVFRGSEKDILRWSKATSGAIGVSRREALEAAGVFGNMIVPMGIARDRAGEMSKRMVRLAGDMASFNNASPEETLDALRAGLAGETEPLRRFGVFLNQARVEQIALNKGLWDGKGTIDAAAKAQATYALILRDTGDAQGDFARTSDSLANKQRILRARIENISAGIGGSFLPAAEGAAGALDDLLAGLEKIATRKDIDLGQKLNLAKADLAPVAAKLKAELDRMDLGDKLADAVEEAIPKMADRAAETAPKVASAFVGGFLDAGAWGRLVIAGLLLKKMGGVGAFTRLGSTAGDSVAAGVASAPGWKGAAGKIGRFIGPQIAVAAGVAFAPEAIKNIADSFRSANTDEVEDAVATMMKRVGRNDELIAGNLGLGNVPKQFGDQWAEVTRKFKGDDVADALERVNDAYTELGNNRGSAKTAKDTEVLIARMREAARVAGGPMATSIDKMADELEDTTRPTRDVARAIERLANRGSGSMDDLRTNVRLNMRLIRQSLDRDSDEGQRAIYDNFRAAARAVENSMEASGNKTREGMALIESYMRRALAQYGITGRKAEHYLAGRDTTGKQLPVGGNRTGAQRGAYISDGAPSGDSVPAVLERGEYVLNRKAVKAIGRGTLDRINFKDAPRFQKGGPAGGKIIELLHPFNDPAHGGSNSHLHVAMSTSEAIVALGRWLQGRGWLVGEHPAFGGVSPVHTGPYHYSGQAIDVNWPDAGAEGAKIRALLPLLGDASSGALRDVVKRIKLKGATWGGPGGTLGAVGQRTLDITRRAAQDALDRARRDISQTSVSGGNISAGGQYNKAELADLWVQAGGPRDVANVAAAVALAESGGNPSAQGPVTSYGFRAGGLWQIHPPQPGWQDPLKNARMAVGKYRGAGGWSPWEAYTNGSYRQYLQRGGVVQALAAMMQRGGGVPRYPLSRRGPIIGVPYSGTHTLGNWQSDNAVDIGVPVGTKVLADMNGTIIKRAGSYSGGASRFDGVQLTLQGNAGQSWYTHLSRSRVNAGDRVRLGQVLGATGAANGVPHLHFARNHGDPRQWIERVVSGREAEAPRTGGTGSARSRKQAERARRRKRRLRGAGLGRLLAHARGGDVPGLMKRIRALGLPEHLAHRLRDLKRDVALGVEGTGRAELLTTDVDTTGYEDKSLEELQALARARGINPTGLNKPTLLARLEEPIPGVYGGKSQFGWLVDTLRSQFRLRNTFIRARDAATSKRGEVDKLTGKARTRLAETINRVAEQRAEVRQIDAALTEAEKKPQKNAALIRTLRARKRAAQDRLDASKTLRDGLRDKVIPGLVTQSGDLKGLAGRGTNGILDSLDTLQGAGSPLTVLKALPPLGVLGGDILQTELSLADLTRKKPIIADDPTDTGTGDTGGGTTDQGDSATAEALRDLLREANLRTAVSERAFGVLRNMPPYGGSYADGGVIPGPIGAPRTVIAHGGETVTPVGAGSPNFEIHVHVQDRRLLDLIDVRVEQTTRRQARSADRGLPGRGGGLVASR